MVSSVSALRINKTHKTTLKDTIVPPSFTQTLASGFKFPGVLPAPRWYIRASPALIDVLNAIRDMMKYQSDMSSLDLDAASRFDAS
jgi:hypothetical protein